MHVIPSAGPLPGTLPIVRQALARDLHWEDCRNSLGIARLLVQEDRPETLVATACRTAIERACRAALEQAHIPYEGDVEGALRRLGCFDAVGAAEGTISARARLVAAERVVSWVAVYLRGLAPERPWGF